MVDVAVGLVLLVLGIIWGMGRGDRRELSPLAIASTLAGAFVLYRWYVGQPLHLELLLP